MPFPYIFTFYSFKGGVGRSLALLNVAYTLAGRGRHVLLVDMDIEAPGISGFLDRQQELSAPAAAHPLDILSLLSEAIAAVRAGGEMAEMARNLPPVSNYIRAIGEDKLTALRPQLGQLGRLDVLGTDLKRNYWERLAVLGLKDLPQDQLIALSRLLHHYFKAQRFPHRPLGLEDFEAPLSTAYDYVLVDSRTGYTEIGGLCVGPLADRLVVLTGLNDQSLYGTVRLLEEIGIKPEPRPADDEPWDDTDAVTAGAADNPSLGPKPTIVVATPVPTAEIAYKRDRLEELKRRVGIHPESLPYHPLMGLIETVFVRDYQEEHLAVQYQSLATRIMAQVGDDPASLARKSQAAWSERKDLAGAISLVLRLASQQPEMGAALLAHLANLGPPSDDDRWATRQLCAFQAQRSATRPVALDNWGAVLSLEAGAREGKEADWLFEEALRKFAEALRLRTDSHKVLYNWGTALLDQAGRKMGGEADRLFEEARGKFAQALKLKPDYYEVLINWGVALSDQAKTKAGEEADRLFEEAGRKFAEALKVKPELPEALHNWGIALFEQAKTKAGEALGESLQRAARNKLLEAERIRTGAGAYPLACIEAFKGNTNQAIPWLRFWRSSGGQLTRASIAEDRDFDGIRNDPEFVRFVESLPEK